MENIKEDKYWIDLYKNAPQTSPLSKLGSRFSPNNTYLWVNWFLETDIAGSSDNFLKFVVI